jgi:BASS family bile acid:Na+ symporter
MRASKQSLHIVLLGFTLIFQSPYPLVCGFSFSPRILRVSSIRIVPIRQPTIIDSAIFTPRATRRKLQTKTSIHSVADEESPNPLQPNPPEVEPEVSNRLDDILSRLTSAFPLFVLGSAILGFMAPTTLNWVSRGNLISLMLASVMMGTGMTLERKDFTDVLKENFASVPAGVLCQFIIMPASAFFVGTSVLLKRDATLGPVLFLGLALVGCSPGGTASNLVSLIAKADVALSVLLTSCSTILASVVTPLLVKLLVGSTVQVSGLALCSATARVVLLPVILGMLLNAKAPGVSRYLSRFTPFASVLLVAIICGGVVSNNASVLVGSTVSSSSSSSSLLPWIIGSVLMLHSIGFLVGYLVPRFGLKYTEKTARTISIETGMQNSALAVVLAQSIGAHPLAALPGALSATVHSCLGSILAAYWRFQDSRNVKENVNDGNDKSENAWASYL